MIIEIGDKLQLLLLLHKQNDLDESHAFDALDRPVQWKDHTPDVDDPIHAPDPVQEWRTSPIPVTPYRSSFRFFL